MDTTGQKPETLANGRRSVAPYEEEGGKERRRVHRAPVLYLCTRFFYYWVRGIDARRSLSDKIPTPSTGPEQRYLVCMQRSASPDQWKRKPIATGTSNLAKSVSTRSSSPAPPSLPYGIHHVLRDNLSVRHHDASNQHVSCGVPLRRDPSSNQRRFSEKASSTVHRFAREDGTLSSSRRC